MVWARSLGPWISRQGAFVEGGLYWCYNGFEGLQNETSGAWDLRWTLRLDQRGPGPEPDGHLDVFSFEKNCQPPSQLNHGFPG